MVARVKFYNEEKKYGFIRTKRGGEYFFYNRKNFPLNRGNDVLYKFFIGRRGIEAEIYPYSGQQPTFAYLSGKLFYIMFGDYTVRNGAAVYDFELPVEPKDCNLTKTHIYKDEFGQWQVIWHIIYKDISFEVEAINFHNELYNGSVIDGVRYKVSDGMSEKQIKALVNDYASVKWKMFIKEYSDKHSSNLTPERIESIKNHIKLVDEGIVEG